MASLLIDYLEEVSAELQELQVQLRRLDQQYRNSYDRHLREEMERLKKTIRKKRNEVQERLYRSLDELRLLRLYFPDLFQVLREDAEIGSLLEKKNWILEALEASRSLRTDRRPHDLEFKPQDPPEAEKKLQQLKEERRQLRGAEEFLAKWVGSIDRKSLVATWPSLDAHIKNDLDKDEALAAVKEADRALRKKGWALLLNEPLIFQALHTFLQKLHGARAEEIDAKKAMEKAQGQGTKSEYEALEKWKASDKTCRQRERTIRHLLLSNPRVLATLQIWASGPRHPAPKSTKKFPWENEPTEALLRKLLPSIQPLPVPEKIWLEKMKERLA